MATHGAESLDSYFYSSYNPYNRYHKPKGAGWKYKNYLSNYGNPEAYFDTHQMQLKSILSQINPKLGPRQKKVSTKDVAVQVNPRIDSSVQCSLGPGSLLTMKRDGVLRQRKDSLTVGSPKGSAVRYPRTLAVYSPIAYRSITSFKDNKEASSPQEETDSPKPAGESEGDIIEDKDVAPKDTTEDDEDQSKSISEAKQPVKRQDIQSLPKGSKVKARVRFQFLEQKYGYYHCQKCNIRWESAYVWCVQATSKVYFKQYCRTCQKAFNPYRVEDLTCHTCKKARCSCPVTPRHVDPKRPHRQDLCGRCKGKKLSCDSTFSYKYII